MLKLEIQAANSWVEEIRKNELMWIENGVDPDSAFSATYYDEPSSDALNIYNARKIEDQIEEDYWLSVQLQNINKIDEMYSILDLPDSTKKWVDSIYQVEFSMLPEETEVEADQASEKASTDDSSIPVWTYFAGGAALLILLLFVRKFMANRN